MVVGIAMPDSIGALALLMAKELIVGLAMGFAFFGEKLSSIQIAGTVLSLFGIYAVSHPRVAPASALVTSKVNSHGRP